jgi:hypothetical protein
MPYFGWLLGHSVKIWSLLVDEYIAVGCGSQKWLPGISGMTFYGITNTMLFGVNKDIILQ